MALQTFVRLSDAPDVNTSPQLKQIIYILLCYLELILTCMSAQVSESIYINVNNKVVLLGNVIPSDYVVLKSSTNIFLVPKIYRTTGTCL